MRDVYLSNRESDETEVEFSALHVTTMMSLFPTRVTTRTTKSTILPGDVIMIEWRKCLTMLPEDVVRKTLEATTNFYSSIEGENWMDPRCHFCSRFAGLRIQCQNEEVATDTFYPTVTTQWGNTCSQFFTGLSTKRSFLYTIKTESYNTIALKDFVCQHGALQVIKSDNARSELGHDLVEYMRKTCVEDNMCSGNEHQEIKPSTSNKGDSQADGEDNVTKATPNNS